MGNRLNTIYVAKEAVSGTEQAIARANVRLAKDVSMDGLKGDIASRELERDVGTNSPAGFANARRGFKYALELVGSGAAGTAPVWMNDLTFCGMAEPVLVAGVSATQRFAEKGVALNSCTAHYYLGAERRRAIGARGTWSLMIEGGTAKKPYVMYDMIGFPAGGIVPDEVALAGVDDYAAFATVPLPASPENTSFTLGNYALALRSAKIDANIDVSPRYLASKKYINLGDRTSSAEFMVERPSVAVKNYYTNLIGETQIPFDLIHGLVAGNICQITEQNAQIIGVEDALEGDVPMLKINAQLNFNTLTLIAR